MKLWRARSRTIDFLPLTAGIGDMDDELYSLNDTGKDIWDRLDGEHSLRQIASDLTKEYTAPSRGYRTRALLD